MITNQVSVICNAPSLIRECLSPAALHKEGAANLKRPERLTQSILRANQMVRSIRMLSIKGEGDTQVRHDQILASSPERAANCCQLSIPNRQRVRVRVPVATLFCKSGERTECRLHFAPCHTEVT